MSCRKWLKTVIIIYARLSYFYAIVLLLDYHSVLPYTIYQEVFSILAKFHALANLEGMDQLIRHFSCPACEALVGRFNELGVYGVITSIPLNIQVLSSIAMTIHEFIMRGKEGNEDERKFM
jgi:hypothetical protein